MSTQTISLKKDSNFSDLEKLLCEVSTPNESRLKIPNQLAHSGGLGVEGAALQVLATWLRSGRYHELQTWVAEDADRDSFINLCNSMFGLCALRLPDKILDRKGQSVEKTLALECSKPIFRNIRSEDFIDAFKGPYLALPVVKSLPYGHGKSQEFNNPLYNSEEVVGPAKFYDITKSAIYSVYPKINKDHWFLNNLLPGLSEILRELFVNTHKHARKDINNQIYSLNFRGLIFKKIGLSEKRIDEISKSCRPRLSWFLGQWRPEKNKTVAFIDVTVIDSGPGYGARWTGKEYREFDFEEEAQAIVDCFRKHYSSDARQSSGSGLSNVLRDLKKIGGWFRLRTGRAVVEKEFFDMEGEARISRKDITNMENIAEGTAINIIIPIKALTKVK